MAASEDLTPTTALSGVRPESLSKTQQEPASGVSIPESDFSYSGATRSVRFGPPIGRGEVGTLGPYRIVKELGRGGMGAVYAAWDTRLDRRVALKVMLPSCSESDNSLARFILEARAAARVKHDNIVTIYEADERDGITYIAMEYLEGRSLEEHLKRESQLELPQIVRIGKELADGLAAAHAAGLVHRDIKPSNIWLEAPNGRVKILDFGLAKPLDSEKYLTGSGLVVGTPAYMSPEQAHGQRLDPRSDLFSLGIVLYRLCTGHLPFDGPTTLSLLVALATEEPVPVRELNPSIPESLARLIAQLLAKDAHQRPHTAEDVGDRLQAIAEELATPMAMPATVRGIEPAVVYVPIPVSVLSEEESPFRELLSENGETSLQTRPATLTERRRRRPAGLSAWLYAGIATLSAMLLGGSVIIIIRNKDGSELKIEVPEGASVVVKDKGKVVGKFGPAAGSNNQKPPPATAGDDRKAAEFALSLGGSISIAIDGTERKISKPAELPQTPFFLTTINLANTRVSDDDLVHFKDCKHLRTIGLGYTQVGDAGLAHFKNCGSLNGLFLEHTRVTNNGLAYFKGCQDLHELDIRGTVIDDNGLSYLRNNNLRLLIVSHTNVGDTGLAYFADKDLVAINVGYSKVTRPGLATFFSKFKNYPHLRFLDLGGTPVTDDELRHFKECENIQWLYLQGTPVTDAGLENFKKCKNLWELHLGGLEGVTDAGLKHFTGCQGLERLVLSGTQVSDAGLARFSECKGLKVLEIESTDITDLGLKHLKELKKLNTLIVKQTKVSSDGIADFHKALPSCRIVHDGGVIEPE